MNYEEKMKQCDNCKWCGERYFYGNTARYCGEYDKFCHDLKKCEKFEEIEDEED